MRFNLYIPLIILLILYGCGTPKTTLKEANPIESVELSNEDSRRFGRLYIDAAKEKILGNDDKAIEKYQSALHIDPTSAAAHYELGLLYSKIGNNDLAYQEFKTANQIDPNNFWYKISYATLLQSQGLIDESIEVFQDMVDQNPSKVELRYELAKLLLDQNKSGKSIEQLNAIEGEIGISQEISFLKQRIYLSENDVNAAAEEIEKLISAFPQELKYYALLSEIYMNNGKEKEALEVYERMRAINPENYTVQFALAQYYRKTSKKEEYLEAIQKAFANPKMSIDDKIKYILTFYQVNSSQQLKKAEGIMLCRKVAEAHPENAKAHALLADYLYFDNQREEAKLSYFNTIRLDSSRFPVWNQLLIILSETNDKKNLLAYGARALDLFPNQPNIYLIYGLGLLQDEQYQNAIKIFDLGKDLVLDNPALKSQLFSSMGDAHHELGNDLESDESYDKALEIDPNNVYVLNNYSYYLSLRKERLDLAKEMSLKSNTLAPNQSSFQDTYAWILFQMGNYEEANEWIDKALKSDANSGVLLEHKGDILYQLGMTDEAMDFWKKAKEAGGASDLIDKKIKEMKLFE